MLDSELPLPLLKQKQLQLAIAFVKTRNPLESAEARSPSKNPDFTQKKRTQNFTAGVLPILSSPKWPVVPLVGGAAGHVSHGELEVPIGASTATGDTFVPSKCKGFLR